MNLEQVNSAWDKVSLARCKSRPTSLTLIKYLCPDFVELHGDRLYGDDPTSSAVSALLRESRHHHCPGKRANDRRKIMRNFRMPHPEGYRKP